MYVADMLASRHFVTVWCIFKGSDPSGWSSKNTRSVVEREGTRPTQRLDFVYFVLVCSRLQVQLYCTMEHSTKRILPHLLVSMTDHAQMHRGLVSAVQRTCQVGRHRPPAHCLFSV
jgi:hypothetical protein